MAKQQGNRAASCQPQQKRLSVGSLFAGIGGLELGLERCGMDVRWQVEIDPWARQVLAKHWPNVERHDDIKTWPKPDTERVDVICGGFPCQDISTAGKGAGLAGARSGLFYEAMRVVRDLEPRYVLLENVAALLVRGMDAVLGELAQVGFDAVWHCVTAAHVGAPHRRDRVFIIGYRPSSLADPDSEGLDSGTRTRESQGSWKQTRHHAGGRGKNVANTKGGLLSGINGRPESGIRFAERRQAVADTEGERCREAGGNQSERTEERATGRRQAVADTRGQGAPECDRPRRSGESTGGTPQTRGKTPRPSNGPPCANVSTGCRQALADTDDTGVGASTSKTFPHREETDERRQKQPQFESSGSSADFRGFWAAEPAVGRVAHGVPRRVDRLRGLGNAVVPQVAQFVGEMLLDIHRGQIPAPGVSVYPLRETDIKPT